MRPFVTEISIELVLYSSRPFTLLTMPQQSYFNFLSDAEHRLNFFRCTGDEQSCVWTHMITTYDHYHGFSDIGLDVLYRQLATQTDFLNRLKDMYQAQLGIIIAFNLYSDFTPGISFDSKHLGLFNELGAWVGTCYNISQWQETPMIE